MMTYDFDDFLIAVKYLELEDIIATATKKCQQLESKSGKPNRKDALILADKIHGLLLWVQTSKKPKDLLGSDFLKLRPMTENLIKNGEMKPEAISVFKMA